MAGGKKLSEAFVTLVPDDKGFAAKAQAMVRAALKTVNANVPVELSVTKASVAALKATIKAALSSSVMISVGVTKASIAKMRADVKAGLDNIAISPTVTAASLAKIRAETKLALSGISLNIAGLAALKTLALGLTAAGAAAGGTGNRINGLTAIFGRFRFLSGNAIHIIIGTMLELTAILVPAAAAATAWAAVWLQGTANVVTHMNAVYTATEAIGSISQQTAGQMVGLGNALQKAQDKANPDVYQALGGFIKLINTQSGAAIKAGTQMGKVFDTFVAKLVYDFSSAGDAGKTMNKIFSNMVPDLTGVGQVFGNLGHTLALLAASMPGLAEVMLGLLSVILHGINDVVTFAAKFNFLGVNIFTAIIAVEEFMRWGGLLVSLMGKIGLATDDVGTKFLSFQRFSGVFTSIFKLPLSATAGIVKATGLVATGISGMVSKAGTSLSKFGGLLGGAGGNLTKLGAAGEKAGTKVSGFAKGLEDTIKAIPAWQVAIGVVAAAAVGFLIYKLVTGKTAAQQFAQSLQDALGKATNIQALTVITDGLGTLRVKIEAASSQLRDYSARADEMGVANQRNATIGGKFAGSVGGIVNQVNTARGAIQTYTDAQKMLGDESVNVLSNSARLAAEYHTTIPGAMALADEAGVKLTQNIFGQGEAAAIARNKIADLVQGYASMGRPLSVVGNDMVAVAIQAGEQQTKVAQVTQAWTAYLQALTGGTNDLAGFQTSLKNITSGIASVSHNLSKGGGLTGTVTDFGKILDGVGKNSSQAWQNFDQVVGQTAPDLINWLTTAGSMGAVSGKQFVQAAKDMIAQLLPFAKGSKTAQAELSGLVQMAGGPAITSFKGLVTWVGNTGNSSKNLQKIIDQVTQKMSNMSKIAQNLGTVLQTQLVDMMDKARISASGAQGAMVNYTKDLEDNTAKTAKGQSDRKALIADLEKTGLSSQQAKRYVDTLQKSIDAMKGKTVNIDAAFSDSGGAAVKAEVQGKTWVSHLVPAHGAKGMRVPGAGNGDTVPAMLTPGEAVVPKHLVGQVAPFLSANKVPGFADGGLVPGFAAGGLAKTTSMVDSTVPWAAAASTKWGTQTAGAWASQAADAFMKDLAKAIAAASGSGSAIVKDAMHWLGKIPYVWGGTAVPGGADCSGFTQSIYGRHGISAPRTSEAQYAWAKKGPPVPGGLAFYVSSAGGPPPGHVAIVGDNGNVISQGGGLGPQLHKLHFGLPLMGTGTPPGGFPGTGGPGGGRRSLGQLEQLWIGAGGPGGMTAHIAAAIAEAESGGNPSAHNASGASGLWQILGNPFPGDPFNPATNAAMAVAKYRDARGFGPWVTYVDGAYRRFMNQGGLVPKSFDRGGMLAPGMTMAWNGTGKPEPVGKQAVHVTLQFPHSNRTEQDLLMTNWIQRLVQVQGGGDVSVAFGRVG